MGGLGGNSVLLGLLVGSTFKAALLDGLVAETEGLGLVSNQLGTGSLGLGLVDVLHEDALVLEDVTLHLHVESVVHVLVNFASLTVLAQHATKDAHTAQPDQLGGHAGVTGTVALTSASVASLALGLGHQAHTEARLDGLGLLEYQAVLDELAHSLARGGIANFGGLVGIHPNFALTSLHDAGSQATLQTKVRPI